MALGKNTIDGNKLLSYVERVERIDIDRKALTTDRQAIIAEAKDEGFVPAGINYVVKARAKKPHDRQEEEQLRDLYMHSCGLGDPGPLFRLAGLAKRDKLARDAVLDTLKELVPAGGELIAKIGGKPMIIRRDKKGEATMEEYFAPAPPEASPDMAEPPRGSKAPPPPPDCDDAGAETLGRQAWQDNVPITANPFPYGDARRPRWDKGWRAESGGDGMGPEEDDGE